MNFMKDDYKMKLDIFLMVHFVSVLSYSSDGKCFKPGVTLGFCCADYQDVDGKCTECPIGMFSNAGNYCTVCEVGYYGKLCFHECKCKDHEICHNVMGCTTPVKSFTEEDDEVQTEWMMTFSISAAIVSMVIVLVISVSKCMMMKKKEGTIREMSKKCKEKSCVRKINIYGTYGRKKIVNEEEEYEFDSDRLEEEGEAEDAYAVIRDSQMIPHNAVEIDDQCDMFDNYFTSDYNHLNLNGISKSNTNQENKKRNYSLDVYGNNFNTFQDQERYF